MALGDYDNDGRSDILVANNGEPPLLLRNNTIVHIIGLVSDWSEHSPTAMRLAPA
jgi:hypothetical protein